MRTRLLINMPVSRYVRANRGVVLRHRQLEGINTNLMHQDGVYINDIGLHIFLAGLHDAIERAIFLLVSY